MTDELDRFRTQWKAEIAHKKYVDAYAKSNPEERLDTKTKARGKFNDGIEHEKNGEMAKAVSCYREAIKLYPEIEDEWTVTKPERKVIPAEPHVSKTEDIFIESLLDKLRAAKARFLPRKGSDCQFEKLPDDIIIIIFAEVVGQDNDLLSLERLSMVNSAFYVFSRDNRLWRNVHQKSTNTPKPEMDVKLSWRDIYLSTPHLYFNGFYACKVTYIRHGESSFQDKNFMPWQTVVYYRILKLHQNGQACYAITSDKPWTIYDRSEMGPGASKEPFLNGTWSLNDDSLVVTVDRPCEDAKKQRQVLRRRGEARMHRENLYCKQTLTLEFKVVRDRKYRFALEWKRNELVVERMDGKEMKTVFDADNAQQYPTLSFYPIAKMNLSDIPNLEGDDDA